MRDQHVMHKVEQPECVAYSCDTAGNAFAEDGGLEGRLKALEKMSHGKGLNCTHK